ncbi:MAG: glycosyltransferase family 4 protein [Novosphingobium sp.]|nr:glycosyltransferase family 4 protein [Novosphingobium sp.]
MPTQERPRIALVWSQFAAYHVDRCRAVAQRFAGRADVLAIEVATTSTTYAWEPSGEVEGAEKVTLFPGQSFDAISRTRRFRALLKAVRGCRTVFLGIGYNELDVIALSWVLRLLGKRVVMMTESKFDDFVRTVRREALKSLILSSYSAAIVGAARQHDYMRFLGFRRRPVLPGYDGVSLARIRAQGGADPAPGGLPHGERDFLFVGRFVAKKNLLRLIDGYAAFVALAGEHMPRLVLIGSGPEEPALRARIEELGLAARVEFPGFLSAEAVSRRLARALALILVSTEEQWGLVVNEALAFGLPAIVSTAVGARDVLVRNLVNGFVIEPDSSEGIAQAMLALASDPALWARMVSHSHERAWMGDAERLADAAEVLLFPDAAGEARNRVARLTAAMAALSPAPRRPREAARQVRQR